MKSPPDSWWISFTYDPVHDLVDASFRDVILETDEDVVLWRREVEKRFQRYGRPVDLIIDLEGLIVKPSAARAFGAHRAEVLAENTRVSYRFNGNPQTRTSIYTSSVIHGADANIYESRDDALKALLSNRESGTIPNRTPLAPASQRAASPRGAGMAGPPSQRPPASSSPSAGGPTGGPLSQRPASSGPVSQRPISSGPVSQHPSPSDPPPAPPAQPPPTTPPPGTAAGQAGPRPGPPLSKR